MTVPTPLLPPSQVKIIMQISSANQQTAAAQAAAKNGLVAAFLTIGRTEGIGGYWRGNLPQARERLRVTPTPLAGESGSIVPQHGIATWQFCPPARGPRRPPPSVAAPNAPALETPAPSLPAGSPRPALQRLPALQARLRPPPSLLPSSPPPRDPPMPAAAAAEAPHPPVPCPPVSASYEKLKKLFADEKGELSVPARLAAGAGAACISTAVRARPAARQKDAPRPQGSAPAERGAWPPGVVGWRSLSSLESPEANC